jgi:hypothetical protein
MPHDISQQLSHPRQGQADASAKLQEVVVGVVGVGREARCLEGISEKIERQVVTVIYVQTGAEQVVGGREPVLAGGQAVERKVLEVGVSNRRENSSSSSRCNCLVCKDLLVPSVSKPEKKGNK